MVVTFRDNRYLLLVTFSLIIFRTAVYGANIYLPDTPSSIEMAEKSFINRHFKSAIEYGVRALSALDKRDYVNRIRALNILGASAYKIGLFHDSGKWLEQALLEGERHLKDNIALLSDTHFFLGQYYDLLGQSGKALFHHHLALRYRSQHFGPSHLKVAESFRGLGEVYTFSEFDYKKAIEFYQKSIRIMEPLVPSDDYERYASYFNIGQAYRMLGDLDNASMYALRALTVVTASEHHRILLGKCYGLLADIEYGKGSFESALLYRLKSIQYIKLAYGDNHYELIQAHTNLGLIYTEMTRFDLAIDAFKSSLAIDITNDQSSELKEQNLLYLGRVYEKLSKHDLAKEHLDSYLANVLAQFGFRHPKASEAYSYLAKYYQQTRKFDSALVYIQTSIAAAVEGFEGREANLNPPLTSILDQSDLFDRFAIKGSVMVDLFRTSKQLKFLLAGLDCYKIATILLDIKRNTYQHDGSKLFLEEHYHSIYEQALETCKLLFEITEDAYYAQEAFFFFEKGKALLLADALKKAEIFSAAGVPDSLRELERKLNSALAAYRTELEKNKSETSRAELNLALLKISEKQRRLRDTLARHFPSYFQVKYQTIAALPQVQEYARSHRATIVEYFWGDKKLFVLGISGEKIVFREIGGLDSLTENVRNYYECLRKIPAWKDNALSYRNFFVNGNRIYNKALRPVLDELRSEKIIIIRDGPLLMIPFESLPVSKAGLSSHDFSETDYLLRHRTISYAHSADLLLKTRPKNSRLPAKSSVLAFSFSRSAEGREISLRNEMDELPGAAREITAISQIFPGTYLLGEEATERKFKILAPQYDILHLAVHGKSDPEKQFSGSLFFKRTADDEEDGELHVYELYDLSLKARLAVLSACESGVGKIFRGEGVFNIARGFAYAGCPSTLMTLWPVPDNVSALIMGEFYRQLGDGEQIDESLRTAKLNYLGTADPQLAHPAFWAAYIPTGLMEPVVPSTFANNTFRMGLAVIATLTMLFLLGKRIQRRVRREGRSPIHRE